MSKITSNEIFQRKMFYPMNNVIKNYSWGSYSSFDHLFGIKNESGRPQAEMWMGTHPNGCSTVQINEENIKLSSLINQDRSAFLGQKVFERFGELPFLFKILTAEKALSIQVHPSKVQAEYGYSLEEQKGIPLHAAHRNYKDSNHKPELIYALTKYTAMNGFRPIDEIISLFATLSIPILDEHLRMLTLNQTENGLKFFFFSLLSLRKKQKMLALLTLLAQIRKLPSSLSKLILELQAQYPGDIGLFTPLVLNVVTLQPGQAMYIDIETPHAYIKGTGLEIMANSDNVLRAGLTAKYIDVQELINCTNFNEKPLSDLLLSPIEDSGIQEYPIPVDDFSFAIFPHSCLRQIETNSAEILLSLDQPMTLTHKNGESLVIGKGRSVFIPAYAKKYTLNCKGRVTRAYT